MVVFSKNPVYSVLYLVITFFAVSGHYLLLGAEFLFIVNLIVYAGAIMVLFLYVIMLLNLNNETEQHKSYALKFGAVISAGMLLTVLIGAIRGAENAQINLGSHSEIGYVRNLGLVLYRDFMLPFEVASILLLAAMVGAVMLGKTQRKREEGTIKSNFVKTTDYKNVNTVNSPRVKEVAK